VFALAVNCATPAELTDKMVYTQERLKQLEAATVGQSSNKLWSLARKGRLTASNFYRVYTRIESLKRNPNLDCNRLVKNLIHPPFLGHLPQITHGSTTESVAISKFIDQLTALGHKNVAVQSCGIFIDPLRSYIGASPDGIVSCDCCPDSLLEIKCPSLSVSQLSYLNAAKKLKQNHAYFAQVQGQLHVCGFHLSYFYVYTDQEQVLDIISRDKAYYDKIVRNLEVFYMQFMARFLIRGKW
jgi:hypothetical protein